MLIKIGDNTYAVEDKLYKKIAFMADRVSRPKPEQDACIQNSGYEGEGKCLKEGSKVLMADGEWKNIENIKEGEEVLSPQEDGSIEYSKVTGVTNWLCHNTFDVIQLNKTKKKLYTCSNNHPIPLNICSKPRSKLDYNKRIRKWYIDNIPAEEVTMFDKKKKQNITSISSPTIYHFKSRINCVVEPYTLGVYLGDGSSVKKRKDLKITSADEFMMEEVSKHYPIMNVVKTHGRKARTYCFSLNGELFKQIDGLNLIGKGSGEKFIPKEALLSDSEYRKKLLAGLIDTDGFYYHGGYIFTLKSKILIENIRDLVYSLGGRTGEIREVTKKCQTGAIGIYYSLSLYIGNMELPLRKPYKKKNCNTFYISPNRISIDVIPSAPCRVYGFTIESPSHWFITDNWMVTHNTNTSLVEAAIVKNLTGRKINLFFSTESARKFMQTHTNQLVILDEPSLDALASDANTGNVKNLLRLTSTMRKFRNFLIINFAKFWKFPEFLVVDRALGMVHLYSRHGTDPGRFLYIRKKNLEQLWNDYKKSGKRNYAKLKSFGGRMPFVMDKEFNKLDIRVEDIEHATLDDYNREKDKAIAGIGVKKSKKELKLERELRELKYKVTNLTKVGVNVNKIAQALGVHSRKVYEWRKIYAPMSENPDFEGSADAININPMASDEDPAPPLPADEEDL